MQGRILFNIVLCLIFGVFFFPLEKYHPISKFENYWEEQRISNSEVNISGTVVEVNQTDYFQQIIIKDVISNNYPVNYKVMLMIKKEKGAEFLITPYDKVKCRGSILEQPVRYNPTDMDYVTYLKSEGILARIEVIDIDIMKKTPIFEKINNKIGEHIDYIFQKQDSEKEFSGIIKSLLLGDRSDLDESIQNNYFDLGVGHILVISGFHIGIIYICCTTLSIWLGKLFLKTAIIFVKEKVAILIATFLFGYYSRLISTLVFCWTYCFIIGLSTSNLRACIFITLNIIAKCIWQEDDFLNNIAIAIGIIIIYNPYSLFGVGFQLSFGSMIGIGLYKYIEKFYLDKGIRFQYYTTSKYCIKINLYSSILSSLCITIVIAPILVYHFYKVSYISIFINAFIIKLFMLVIFSSGTILSISFLSLNLAEYLEDKLIYSTDFIKYLYQLFLDITDTLKNLSYEINFILDITNSIVEYLNRVPFGLLAMDSPSMFEIVIYYGVISLIIFLILEERYVILKSVGIALATQLIFGFINIDNLYFIPYFNKPEVVITQLYVGQGDGTIIKYGNKIITIDGGSSSNYSRLKNNINSKCSFKIDMSIISHTDEDHVGAIIEWIKNNNKIELLIVPVLNEADEIDKQIIDLCEQYNIKKEEIITPTNLEMGNMFLDVLVPTTKSSNKNDNSLVLNLNYGDFNMLYTGDISKEVEQTLELKDVDVLKVAHHGSKTSTSEELLELTKPEHAIISCGKNNIYNHPHAQVLENLEKHNIDIWRTDLDGTITIELYKNQASLKKYIRNEK
ncbi:MAG: DNA internalization-related competence protein ComEC/Rec2 [Candidatus Epulonipiscium fishelsonii]|nr:MAG: DNA internalization-related competence protein ComEC/Rec2 [Epulopiscium sp. AS2M-Bin002]